MSKIHTKASGLKEYRVAWANDYRQHLRRRLPTMPFENPFWQKVGATRSETPSAAAMQFAHAREEGGRIVVWDISSHTIRVYDVEWIGTSYIDATVSETFFPECEHEFGRTYKVVYHFKIREGSKSLVEELTEGTRPTNNTIIGDK